jgi:hypothetical protein
VGLPREEQQDEEDSGSRDRELCRQGGGAARKRLRIDSSHPHESPTTHVDYRQGTGTVVRDR